MSTEASYDVVVIGAGPGGYVAAIRASQLGLKTACIERADLGGVCLNWGCIPTKALLHSAHIRSEIAHAEDHGFTVSSVEVAWDKLIARSRGVAKRLSRGVASLLKKYGVTHIAGEAKLDRPGLVKVGEQAITAKHIILATGARPRPLPGLDFDGETVWSSKEALVSTKAPESLLIIGAGAIGSEFAYFYNAFGTKVTLVERADRILPIEDEESSNTLKKAFEKQGIAVKTGTAVEGVERINGKIQARLVAADGTSETIEAEKVLVAIGIMPNTEGLNLEGCAVTTTRGFVDVDAHGATHCPGIWAIGDIAKPPALAHKASAEGVHVAECIAAQLKGERFGKPVDLSNIPNCTYCVPQVASVGLTEAAAKAKGLAYKVGKFPYVANGKALAIDDKDGFVKVLIDEATGQLLGAHIVGSAATELIAEPTLVRSAELLDEDIMASVHAHPTLSEAFYEAVGLALGHSVNL